MKIGFFTNVYKPVVNGVVSSIYSFKKGLEELGHEVYVFAPTYPGYKDDEKNIFRIESLKLPLQEEYRITLLVFNKKSLKVIKELDIIHTHYPFIMGNYGSFFANFHTKPLVFTYHTQYEKYTHYIPFEQEITKKFTRWIVKDYANKCDCVIAPSESIRKMLLKQGIRSRIEVVPTGIDLKVFENADKNIIRKKYNIKPEQKLLLYVGRIAKEKNLEFLLKAFKIVLNKKPDTYLMFVGHGPEEGYLNGLIKRIGLEENTFSVSVSRSVQDYYAAADLFVFSSVTETQGLVLVESMAAGTPVVAVDSLGIRDVVNGKNGSLTKESLPEFSEKIIKILENDALRKEMSQNARKTASRYSIQKMSKRMLKVYKSVLN